MYGVTFGTLYYAWTLMAAVVVVMLAYLIYLVVRRPRGNNRVLWGYMLIGSTLLGLGEVLNLVEHEYFFSYFHGLCALFALVLFVVSLCLVIGEVEDREVVS